MMLRINVFVAGMCIMAIEMTAFRLLAPYFGTTQMIITNIIGSILVAIAVGNWIGGKLGDRYQSDTGLSWILLAAAALGLIVFYATKPILGWAADSLSGQDLLYFGIALVATVMLFSIPFVFLGMISPYSVRMMTTRQEHVGTRAGTVFFLGTLGSLIGTYLPTFVFIPTIGSQKTFMVFIGLLVLTGLAGMLKARNKKGVLGAAVLLPMLSILPVDRPTLDNVIARDESLYNLIQVVEKGDRRLLYLNEGHGYHSVTQTGRVLVGGVWDYFIGLPALLPRTETISKDNPLDVLIIGLAAGTISNLYSHFLGGKVSIEGVEIDDHITRLADKHFDLNRQYLKIYHEDGRTFLARPRGPYDIIIVDAYKQPYIPFYLTTKEFFAKCKASLKAGGVLGINVATFEQQSVVRDNIERTLASNFSHLRRLQVSNYDVNFVNNIIVASDKPLMTTELARRFPDGPGRLLNDIEQRLQAVSVKQGAKVFTDDWAPVEWYVDLSLFSFFD